MILKSLTVCMYINIFAEYEFAPIHYTHTHTHIYIHTHMLLYAYVDTCAYTHSHGCMSRLLH